MGIDPAEDLHQGRLARAILSNQSMNLRGVEIESHPVERANARERLRDLAHLQKSLESGVWSLGSGVRSLKPHSLEALRCCARARVIREISSSKPFSLSKEVWSIYFKSRAT